MFVEWLSVFFNLERCRISLVENICFYFLHTWYYVIYIVFSLNWLTLKRNLEGFAQTGSNDDANGKVARMTILFDIAQQPQPQPQPQKKTSQHSKISWKIHPMKTDLTKDLRSRQAQLRPPFLRCQPFHRSHSLVGRLMGRSVGETTVNVSVLVPGFCPFLPFLTGKFKIFLWFLKQERH